MSEAAAAAVWELPPIDGPVITRRRRYADLDLVEREAWDQGFAEGRAKWHCASRSNARRTVNNKNDWNRHPRMFIAGLWFRHL